VKVANRVRPSPRIAAPRYARLSNTTVPIFFDAIYIQGGGWRMTPIIEDLERDLGVPVLISAAADCWEIQHALSFREPVQGLGRLLAELPPPKPGPKCVTGQDPNSAIGSRLEFGL
jgi:maleate cis-trans isomerase